MDFRFAKRYFNYKLFSHHRGGHGIHSPFVYHLLTEVIEKKKKEDAFVKISQLRKELEKDHENIVVSDLGAGSRIKGAQLRKIADIAKNTAVQPKYGELLFRLAKHFQPQTILELGTSLGISTSYLALAAPEAQLITVEGCPSLNAKAKESFNQIGQTNIKQINSDFETALPKIMDEIDRLDFAYFDGNHQYEATINYFEQALAKKHNESVFIFDDIYWSEGMERAWEYIKNHPKVTATINVFQFGIVFFRREMKKQEFIIRF